ncbi:MAG: AMP-binding protein [candidate division WS1 bacterium]|nr:AMP-binding protein [candidate division WS1 bacterium]
MLERFVNRLDFDSYEDFQDNFRLLVPENFNFAYDVVDAWAEEQPDKLALIWCNEQGEEASFTFADFRRLSDQWANYFQSLGLRKGDPVMLILQRRYEFWIAMLALHKLGAIAIPATHLVTAKDIVYRCGAADIKLILCVNDDRVLEHVEAAAPECPSLQLRLALSTDRPGWLSLEKELASVPQEFQRPTGEAATRNEDPMLLYFTSGTTGLPKMVIHDFTYPLGHILTACYWQRVTEDGLHLTLSDTGWAKATWGKIYGQWIGGTALFTYDFERLQPAELLRVISHYGVTTFCAPPTALRFLIREDLSAYDWSRLRYCTTAGEPLNPEVYHAWLRGTGVPLMEGFGQTETVVLVANYPWVKPRPGAMGKPSPGWNVDVLNEEGRSCEVGEEGQLVIHTPARRPVGMFREYHNDPELMARMWHDGIYYTGDTAWRDEDGYYWFVGRADDLIKSSGYRIGPFEVESALLEHPAVLECAITGVPDEIRGQVVKATVVLTRDYEPSEDLIVELQEHVKKVTAPYKYPRIIEFVSELPKTISGKIRRVQIREADRHDREAPGHLRL